MINNQKGAAHLFVILILLVGIGITVYLTQFTQVFKPKAAETALTKITEENYETTLNPWGDPWAWKKNPNPNIPVTLSAPSHYWKYQDPDGTILERHAQYLAKSNAPFLYLDSFEPHVEGQNPKSIALINRVKQLNPSIKFLGYFVQWESPPGAAEIIAGADSGNTTFESFFVHKKGLPPTKENRLWGRPDHPEWGFSAHMDITNPNYRAYVIPKIIQNIRSAKMDGLMNDLLFYRSSDIFLNPPATMPDNHMPDDIKAAWPAGMVAFVQELKAAMGPDLYLFGNVNDDEPQFMQNDLLQAGRLDGVIFEDPFNSRPNTEAIDKVNNLMNIVDSFGKKSIMVVSGAHNGTPYTGSNPTEEKSAHRYFLTAYLMTVRSSNHMFLYYYPTSIFFQYNSEAFFKEWDLNIGSATSAPENMGNGVYRRKFERAFVYWNPTYNNYTIPDGSELFNIENGQNIAGQIVPANSGSIFVTSSLLAEYNRPPVSTSSPSPSPSPSPSIPPSPPPSSPPTRPNFPDFSDKTVAYCNGSTSRIHLEWNQVPGATLYKVFRSTAQLGSGTKLIEQGHFAFNDETVTPGTDYNYVIEVEAGRGPTNGEAKTIKAVYCGPTCESLGGKCLDTLNKDTSGNVCSGGAHQGVRDCPAARPYCYTGSTCIMPPLPSPVISPSPVNASPSPTGKMGDLNGNGKVDIFDFNLFAGYFPSRDIRGDVDKNGQVNIFDFNALITNFGK